MKKEPYDKSNPRNQSIAGIVILEFNSYFHNIGANSDK